MNCGKDTKAPRRAAGDISVMYLTAFYQYRVHEHGTKNLPRQKQDYLHRDIREPKTLANSS